MAVKKALGTIQQIRLGQYILEKNALECYTQTVLSVYEGIKK